MNLMLNAVHIFIILFTLHLILWSQENYYAFDHLTTDDGLSNDRVNCILQDSKGFMWFGTDNGLNKYDGYKFIVYNASTNSNLTITHNNILCLCEDQAGHLWVGTIEGLNCYLRETDNFIQFKFMLNDTSRAYGDWINCICEDSRGNIWIGTRDDGLFLLENSRLFHQNIDSNLTFINYRYDPDDAYSISYNNINTICEDFLGNLWIGTQGGGLNKFDPGHKIFERFEYRSSRGIHYSIIRKIWKESKSANKIWIATQHTLNQLDASNEHYLSFPHDEYTDEGFTAIQNAEYNQLWLGSLGKGIYIFDKQTKIFTPLKGHHSNPVGIKHNWIRDIYKDKNGIVWLASMGGGIYKYDRYGKKFPLYQITLSTPEGDKTAQINSLFEDIHSKRQIIWLGTSENGMLKQDRKNGQINTFLEQASHAVFNCLLQDGDQPNIFWIATWGAALLKADVISGQVERFYFSSNFDNFDPHALHKYYDNNLSRVVIKDSGKNLWHGAVGGLFKINPQNRDYLVYLPDPEDPQSISGKNVTSILEDRSGALWIGTFEHGLNRFDPETATFTHYQHNPKDSTSLDQDFICTMYEDDSGSLWIGTGTILNRFDPEKNSFIHYKGLPGTVKGILGDKQGNLWISSSAGLSKFDPRTRTFLHFDSHDGLQSNQFTGRAIYKSPSGELFFGGPRGFNAFYPENIAENPNTPPVVFTDLQIFNKSIRPGKESPLAASISETKEIKLNYHQSVFSIEFSALDYTAPLKNQFCYKMDGVDPDWVYTDSKRRFATYTQLPAGQYIFRVKAANNDGLWNEEGTSLQIIILPPLWRSHLAYALYILLFGTLLFSGWRFQMNRLKLKHQLELEHLEATKLQEVDHLKSRFFANISHEFRTPLTLILGPLQKWLPKLRNQDLKQDLKLMQRNAHRLYRLINQLLDLSKLEAGSLVLQAREENIVPLLRGYVQSFESQARLKKIELQFSAEPETILLYVDRDKLEQIIYNLLSNAFKFTPAVGSISVIVENPPESPFEKGGHRGIYIKVSDTGRGIPPDKLDHIFDRFYQVDDSSVRDHEGSGIGLALSKELVELHHGKITVESVLGKGTTFTVWLPLGREHLQENEIVTMGIMESSQKVVESVVESEIVGGQKVGTRKKLPLILVVDDNRDVRFYIRGYLESSYVILEAADGNEGLQTAIEKIPDLIISDVMMPEMDGFEFCKRVKSDQRTSHIPVILLTARAASQDRINGLETGADDYLIKPFDARELQVRVKNLIAQREKLRLHYLQSLKSETLELKVISADQAFLEKSIAAAEKYLSDPDFSMEQFAREVGFSHSQLVRKLESITGLSPSLFLRSRRLLRARQLLDQKAGNIAQVAYECGFNNLSYFSRSFKEQFGQLPSKFIKDQPTPLDTVTN